MPSNYYRPDIDGMRAIAVISVIFFHAKVSGFEGGFVGVDIFFVISGFLISNIILREMREEQFSLLAFYERRIRRILPVLLIVILTTSILAWFILLPDDLRRFGKYIVASLLMIPNIAAWKVSGDYFAPSADTNPLLHLWSLGVEEQFYILFPVVLLFAVRHMSRKWCWLLLISTLLLSLGMATWLYWHHPHFGFYWLPARAWEFLLGVVIAYFFHSRKYTNKAEYKGSLLQVLSLLGIILIALSIFLPRGISLQNAFYYQILAVTGATLIIATNGFQSTLSYALLSIKPLVGIGLISYSLYLWHWPLLSLFSYWEAGVPLGSHKLLVFILLIMSAMLSFLTWKYIEQPFRSKEQFSFKSVLIIVVCIQFFIFLGGLMLFKLNGIDSRLQVHQNTYLEGINDKNPLREKCHHNAGNYTSEVSYLNDCLFPENEVSPSFIIWGDSHSDALTPVFIEMSESYGITGIQSSFSGGPALLKTTRTEQTVDWNEKWAMHKEDMIGLLSKSDTIQDVFLVARWGVYYLDRTAYEQNLGNKSLITSCLEKECSKEKAFVRGLEETVSTLTKLGKRVWIVFQVPVTDRNVPRWLAIRGKPDKEVWIRGYPERRKALLPIFERMRDKYGVRLLNPVDFMCSSDNSECIIASGGKALYYDDDHLSASGALFLTDMLRPAFEAMKATTMK